MASSSSDPASPTQSKKPRDKIAGKWSLSPNSALLPKTIIPSLLVSWKDSLSKLREEMAKRLVIGKRPQAGQPKASWGGRSKACIVDSVDLYFRFFWRPAWPENHCAEYLTWSI